MEGGREVRMRVAWMTEGRKEGKKEGRMGGKKEVTKGR